MLMMGKRVLQRWIVAFLMVAALDSKVLKLLVVAYQQILCWKMVTVLTMVHYAKMEGYGDEGHGSLSGGFGAIRLGRQDNPIHTALDSIDPFGTGLTGNIENFFNGYDSRSDNMVTYLTPTVSGFSGQIGYGFGEVPGSTSAGHLLAGLVGYKSGSVKVQLAYHKQNIVDTDVELGNDKTTMLGGFYDFHVAKLHLAYAVNKGDRLGMTTTNSRDMMVGVSIPIGMGTIIGSFLRKKSRIETKATSDLLALGYTYALSKRTTLYTSYGHNRNNDGGTIGPDALVIDPDESASSFDLGIQHRF